MKQNTINKLLFLIVAILILCVALLRVNEHKRVTFYNCYDFYTSDNINATHEDAIEICERND